MGLFSEDIIEQPIKGSRKLQLMIDVERRIEPLKQSFIRLHQSWFGSGDYQVFRDVDRCILAALERFEFCCNHQSEEFFLHGKYKYIKDELYIVVEFIDKKEHDLREQFWRNYDEMRNKIHQTCECPGQLILIYDKDMNLIKEKVKDFDMFW